MQSKCSHKSAAAAYASERIALIAGGEPHMRRFIQAGLERRGYFVEETEIDGAEARVASHPSPAFIVLDLDSRSADADTLRALSSVTNAPIIVLSSEIDGAKNPHLKIGAADHFVKPIGISEFLARCEAASHRQHEDVGQS